MATAARSRRLAREVPELREKNPNYFVNIHDQDLTKFEAYIVGPDDSCYAGKLVKLKIEIPPSYPYVPPKCTFIQHRGGRIHPNLYNQGGKVCLSILGTWQGPGWAFTMKIDTVLITIQSLLDAKPLLHEPGQQDSKAYNDYVRYSTWRYLLLDYNEAETDASCKTFLQSYLKEQGSRIWRQLQEDKKALGWKRSLASFYDMSDVSEIVNWVKLENDVRNAITQAGGSIFGLIGAGQVLSTGQSPSGSPFTTPTRAMSAVSAAHKKRKLDCDLDTAMPPAAKKSAAGHTYSAPKALPHTTTSPQRGVHEVIDLLDGEQQNIKPPRQGKHEIIDLSDDEEPANSTVRKAKGTGKNKPSPTGKNDQVVIVLDDD